MSFTNARVLTPPPDDGEEIAHFPVAKSSRGEEIFAGTIPQQLRAAWEKIDVDACDVDGENAFFVADLAQIYRQYMQWRRELPHVIPFYAVKCNPEPMVVQLLAALGTGFDCASNGEIQQILDLGLSPSRIIYANPCKASSFVRRAAQQKVGLTTFDNMDELDKMKKFHPSCKLVLRILTDDSKSVCQLGIKFGAPLKDAERLLAHAKELGLDVVGVSFHVGSGCTDPEAFRDAIVRARHAFDVGASLGYQFDLLDIGGGFEHDNFTAVASVLRCAIADHFPDDQFAPGGARVAGLPNGLRIIAEPGRYFVQRAFVLATNIIARRVSHDDEDAVASHEPKPEVMYYQNDGTYGAFNCLIFDHQHVQPKALSIEREFVYREDLPAPGIDSESTRFPLGPCSVWGPTCDSIDCILRLTHLPRALNVGDWLVYEGMGAYTLCAASNFNGLEAARVRYTIGSDTVGDHAPEVILGRLQSAGMASEV
ncbi:ornithine decarboxylase [Malassezia yamatoensis]|uniref:ornithine decarboxylase n=1 Tax=Malassezia yamatoensis TaxID=253288 RepID=A0AAJ6CHC0_9BASI|nr:ornithine decarboxylase [Malassezia yamatoensis]